MNITCVRVGVYKSALVRGKSYVVLGESRSTVKGAGRFTGGVP